MIRQRASMDDKNNISGVKNIDHLEIVAVLSLSPDTILVIIHFFRIGLAGALNHKFRIHRINAMLVHLGEIPVIPAEFIHDLIMQVIGGRVKGNIDSTVIHTFSMALDPSNPDGLTRRMTMRMTKATASRYWEPWGR